MAYSTALPPVRVGGGLGGGGSLWIYQSEDVHTDVDASLYFTDGDVLGMKVGDVVFVVETDNTYAQTTHSVTVVTAGSGATISAAT